MNLRSLSGALLLAGCAAATPAPSPTSAPAKAPVAATAVSPASSAAWADSVLATMSLRERAAQMVWPNLMGNYTPADADEWKKLVGLVTEEKVGGVLISVGSPTEIAVKLNALQQVSALPLLVSADLETGAGMRARGGYFVPNGIDLGSATWFPPNMALGATGDTALAYEAGRITALEGRALGIHINFAPVLDVNNNPANPVINTRSYGDHAQLVARLGRAYIRGVQAGGMIATGKHFPGHGDTDVNSHLALPVVSASRARLDSLELVPFRAAIAEGVGAIMTFHGAMPALDTSGVPGTLSGRVNTDLLRTQLGFTGLIVSDAMDMRGVLVQYGAAESVKRAVAAGVNVLIQPVDAREAISAIVAGVTEGRYDEAYVTASARRILTLKHQLQLHQQRMVDVDALRRTVGIASHVAVARTIAERSIVVVRDTHRVLPLDPARTPRVLSVTVASRADLGAGPAFNAQLRERIPNVRTAFVAADDPGASYEWLDALADSSDMVIVSSYVGQRWDVTSVSAPARFANWIAHHSARRGARAFLVVAFGNPYLLQQIPTVPGYLIGWGSAPESQRAAARTILGVIPITGTLPTAIRAE